MPEKVTRQEKIISLAIEKARKAKEELSAKQRKNIEPTQVLEIDTDPEVEKIKRPKVQDASKITNQTQKKEGYGLAGESLKKSEIKKSYLTYDGNRNVYNLKQHKGGKSNYTPEEIKYGLEALGMRLEQAEQNDASADHLEMFLNRNNGSYSIPRQNIQNILNKKYGINI